MNRGTDCACRYCSTGEVLRTVRRARRRFGRLLIPDLAFHEFDRVTRRVADVHRSTAEWPDDLPLDLEPSRAQVFGERVELASVDSEGDVTGARGAVRWHEAPRRRAQARPEQQQERSLGDAKRRRAVARRLDLA